ncbi:MAG: hypothetical protein J6Y80_04600, partial [Victivallales bacterium]|nr:hypothetical protein [Victivallales bacterium]
WYEDPVIAEYLKLLQPIRQQAADCSSIARVALVGDLESVYYHGVETLNGSISNAINGTLHAFTHAGAPFDAIASTDIGQEGLPDYQVFVFMNLCYATPEHRAMVEKLRQAGKTLVWLYAPGYLAEQGADLQSLREFTGMNVEIQPDSEDVPPNFLRPLFRPLDAEPFHNGYRKTLANGATSYYFPDGILKADALRELLQAEKVHIYGGDPQTALYANGSYLAFNTAGAGPRTVTFPQNVRLLQLFPERREIPGFQQVFTIPAAERTTYLFQYFKE